MIFRVSEIMISPDLHKPPYRETMMQRPFNDHFPILYTHFSPNQWKRFQGNRWTTNALKTTSNAFSKVHVKGFQKNEPTLISHVTQQHLSNSRKTKGVCVFFSTVHHSSRLHSPVVLGTSVAGNQRILNQRCCHIYSSLTGASWPKSVPRPRYTLDWSSALRKICQIKKQK